MSSTGCRHETFVMSSRVPLDEARWARHALWLGLRLRPSSVVTCRIKRVLWGGMMPTQSQIQRKKRGLGRKEEGKEKRDGVTEGRRQTTVQKAERER